MEYEEALLLVAHMYGDLISYLKLKYRDVDSLMQDICKVSAVAPLVGVVDLAKPKDCNALIEMLEHLPENPIAPHPECDEGEMKKYKNSVIDRIKKMCEEGRDSEALEYIRSLFEVPYMESKDVDVMKTVMAHLPQEVMAKVSSPLGNLNMREFVPILILLSGLMNSEIEKCKGK
ncbi:hypothetical protein IPA_00785 [Ignicoccus pacificus DSM 13166]|uniref:Uncharacterized protein n=1 Tax=Ignicoccus pacificus DSM 13166 TaxID=940294 RepID=A0A977PKG9_9CREN|nr:hypothetical protein IPA_00785 [Ignicoccus pacificus DSM 13166]